MSKGPLPKSVFQVGAAATARIHFATGRTVAEVAPKVWAEYQNQVTDPAALTDWILASDQCIEWVRSHDLPAPAELMRHLQHYCQMYEDDGTPRKKRFLDGLWFAKPFSDPERVATFLRKAQVFCAGASSGLMPLAPDKYV